MIRPRSRRGSRPLLDRINARRPARVQWEKKNPDESSLVELLLGVVAIILWVVILFVILPLMLKPLPVMP